MTNLEIRVIEDNYLQRFRKEKNYKKIFKYDVLVNGKWVRVGNMHLAKKIGGKIKKVRVK